MAIINRQRIRLDLDRTINFKPVVITQFDKDTNYIEVELLKNGELFEFPPTTTLKFQATKPDETIIFDVCELIDNIIVYRATEQLSTVIGNVNCEIGLYDGVDGELLQSPKFKVIIEKPAMDRDGVISSDEFNALTVVINNAEEKIIDMDDMALRVNNAEDLREVKETERQTFYEAYKVLEAYSPAKPYIIGNKVTYLGSTYQNILDCADVLPIEISNWILIAKKGDQGAGGDMLKSTYDPTNKSQDIFAYTDNAIKSKFDATSQIEFVEATVDTDIQTKDTTPILWGKVLKRFNVIKTNLSNITTNVNELVNGKINKTDIVQTDTVSDTTKVPSSAVTNALGLEVDQLTNNLAMQKVKTGSIAGIGSATVALSQGTYLVVIQLSISGQVPVLAIVSATGAIYAKVEITTNNNLALTTAGNVLTITSSSEGSSAYFVYKLL